MVFEPCKAEPDIWMHWVDNLYEYIAVYVDDLCISSKDPKAITDTLTEQYGFKLKGTGLIDCHLGMTFCRNNHDDLHISPQHYIEKMVDSYKQMLNENPLSKANSPLDSNDHPEVDISKFLDEDGIQQYQFLCNGLSVLGILTLLSMSCQCLVSEPCLGMDTLTEPNGWSAISPSFDLPRYEYLLMSLIIQMLRGSNMIGSSLSMVTYQRLSPRVLPPPLGGFITLTHYQKQTCTMPLLQVTLSLVSCTS
jgi:hypothetical protein